jgi:hypothetical protein
MQVVSVAKAPLKNDEVVHRTKALPFRRNAEDLALYGLETAARQAKVEIWGLPVTVRRGHSAASPVRVAGYRKQRRRVRKTTYKPQS